MKEAINAEAVFREHMKEARARAGLTQAELAALLQERYDSKLGRPAVLAIEAGSRRVALDEALTICAALDIAPLYAFTPWEGSSPDDPSKPDELGSVWLRVGEGVLPPDLARRWLRGDTHGPDSVEPEQLTRFYYSNVTVWLR